MADMKLLPQTSDITPWWCTAHSQDLWFSSACEPIFTRHPKALSHLSLSFMQSTIKCKPKSTGRFRRKVCRVLSTMLTFGWWNFGCSWLNPFSLLGWVDNCLPEAILLYCRGKARPLPLFGTFYVPYRLDSSNNRSVVNTDGDKKKKKH